MILGGLAGVVTTFGKPGGATIERYGAATQNDQGSYDPPAVIETFTVNPIVITPAQGASMLSLPEGDRSLETVDWIANVRLRTSREGRPENADVIVTVRHGETMRYLVRTVADWGDYSGAYAGIATRIELP